MTKMFYDIFTIVGFITVYFGIGCLITRLSIEIYQHIRDLIKMYKAEHRLDKPPKAKCYCKDCRYWNTYVNVKICTIHKELVPRMDWFCHDAEPRKEDE